MLAVAALSFGEYSLRRMWWGGEEAKATAVRVALSRSLPPMKADSLKITVLEVTYAPGAASPPHSHPCPVVAYMLPHFSYLFSGGQYSTELKEPHRHATLSKAPKSFVNIVPPVMASTDEAMGQRQSP